MTKLVSINMATVIALENAVELIDREVASTASEITLPTLLHKDFRGIPTRRFPAKHYNIDHIREAVARIKRDFEGEQ